ncbi:phosphate butyryltransferase [Planococcus sp. YIM B11945]|uniref:phosphate butyryltransferase n=1 Tax=Planococcus sp. YIM B11945 TaxID=3435410 RepID=UPI003D7D41DB
MAVHTIETIAVAAAADNIVLEAVNLALQKQLAAFKLFGDEELLTEMIQGHFPQLIGHPKIELVHADGSADAAEKAVQSVFVNESTVLMKGYIPTALFLKAVLHPDFGLRTGKLLSHVAAFEIPGFERLLFITDAAMNIAPDLQHKKHIIQNAVQLATSIGIDMPIVAPLAAIETINPNMPATLDAAALAVMNKRGQIPGCVVDGPLALDNAISLGAAKHKGILGDSVGKADILLVPNIESGNILYKSLIHFSNAKAGSVVMGAKAPIVLASRADSAESRLLSLALAIQSSTIS